MTAFVIPYPSIDPVLFEIGPFAIRWYALSYIAGLVLGWRYIVHLVGAEALWTAPRPGGRGGPPATTLQVDDLLLWVTLGVIVGGRLGYILFYGLVYEPSYYLSNPLRIFAIWRGGMSFHGGLLGVVLATVLYCRSAKLDITRVGDLVAAAAPIGLFFGRLANFINGELFGRPSDVPWAMVFPQGGLVARHPSQLYEAALEGLVLFALLRVVTHHTRALDRPGVVIGSFLAGYGTFRAFAEFFREPEAALGGTVLTMGMLLSVPMWIAAALFIWHALKVPASGGSPTPPQGRPRAGRPKTGS